MDVEKLLLAIVQREDADAATTALNATGLAVTHISSVGGFLEMGNVTLLMGLGRDDVARALAVLSTQCHTRTVFVNAGMHATDFRAASFIAPVKAEVGGATIFVLSVERYIRLGTGYTIAGSQLEANEASAMKLILAIVPDEQSGRLLSALTAVGHRATLISTTGGFLRRGNATLLLGVESQQVDTVLDRIRQVCGATGAAEACATIFILDVERYARV